MLQRGQSIKKKGKVIAQKEAKGDRQAGRRSRSSKSKTNTINDQKLQLGAATGLTTTLQGRSEGEKIRECDSDAGYDQCQRAIQRLDEK